MDFIRAFYLSSIDLRSSLTSEGIRHSWKLCSLAFVVRYLRSGLSDELITRSEECV